MPKVVSGLIVMTIMVVVMMKVFNVHVVLCNLEDVGMCIFSLQN